MRNFFILFSIFYFEILQANTSILKPCGTDGPDKVAKVDCNDDLNIVKWTMGSENFEKFHRYPTDNSVIQGLLPKIRSKWVGDPPNFAYSCEYGNQNKADLDHWKDNYESDSMDGCITWGPYIDIPHPSEIEYEADVYAMVLHTWGRNWPDTKIMFQLELFANGQILDKVVMNWKKYHIDEGKLYLNEDGVWGPRSQPNFGYYKVRGKYISTQALKNVEVRICRFYPYHWLFFIKEVSLKKTYKIREL